MRKRSRTDKIVVTHYFAIKIITRELRFADTPNDTSRTLQPRPEAYNLDSRLYASAGTLRQRRPTRTSRNKETNNQCTCITLFCKFLCRPCTTRRHDHILPVFENVNCKAISCTLSMGLDAASSLQLGLNFPTFELLSEFE